MICSNIARISGFPPPYSKFILSKDVRLTTKSCENAVSRALPSSRTMPIPIQSYKFVCIALDFYLYLPDVIYTVAPWHSKQSLLCSRPLRIFVPRTFCSDSGAVSICNSTIKVDKVQGAGVTRTDSVGIVGLHRATGMTAKDKRRDG